MSGDTYTHGHHDSVLRSHRWRTAENSCGYLLGHLHAGQSLLDIGCGPGNITLDLAALVAPAQVVGVDAAADVVAQAEALRVERKVDTVEFRVDDVYTLADDDDSFAVVHAHQVLQHLTDPVAALREMARVARPGGLVAVRDSDYGAFVHAPDDERLHRWLELYHQVTERNRAQADAGRYLLGWAQQAGLRDAVFTTSTWTFADDETRAWWGGLWADRVQHSAFADQAVAYGLSTADELAELGRAWADWSTKPDGVFVIVHGELLART
jgi:ubiquinone/menaquinone biosynthesis C-methylase UbiE